jgi:endonuclease YncB( thermonuclease family)
MRSAFVLAVTLAALALVRAPAGSAAQCLSLTLPPQAVSRVVDGDTYDLHSVRVPPYERIRVLGVDAAERADSLYEAARDSTAAWLARGPFAIHTCARDSFGRLLAWTSRGVDSLHVHLIRLQLGVPAPAR